MTDALAHRAISIELLDTLPCYAVRVPPGQKDPGVYRWDPAERTEEKSRQEIHRLKEGDDNIGIHLFGHVVDVDIDTDDPVTMAALDYFLPYTAHVWGRASRPRTHRLYQIASDLTGGFDPTQHRFLKAIVEHDALKVEIRGGEQRSGRYTLMPGSVHPSGESYEWDNVFKAKTAPVLVDLRQLVRKLRYACVASLIGRHWTEGRRNDMSQALSGFLHKVAQHSLNVTEDEDPFDYQDAEELFEGIMEIADDDEEDRHMRLSTLKKTWQKADEGHPVTGATRLQELTGEDNLVPLLYLLLVNSAEMQRLDEFMDRFAKIINTSDIVQLDIAGTKEVQWLMSVADFRHTYNSHRIQFGDGKLIPLPSLMLSNPQAIEVHGIGFNPEKENLYYRRSGQNSFRMVNMWRGCDVPAAETVARDEVAPFLDYIKRIVASENDEAYEWVMAWLADIFQNPASKCGTSLALVGRTGAGKSILGDAFIRPILGMNHAMQVNSIESLTGKFNADTSGMLFIQCDEAMNSNRRQDAQKLKSSITDPTKRLEKKGHDAFQVEDFARYYFTSNEITTALAIVDGKDDRRYTVLESNPEWSYGSNQHTAKEKAAYWSNLTEWAENRDNLAKVHRYLLEHTYDRKVVRVPLTTKTKMDMAHQSQQGIDDWLMHVATMGHPLEELRDWGTGQAFIKGANGKWEASLDKWPELITMAALVESYNIHRRGKLVRHGAPDFNPQKMKNELVRRGLVEDGAASNRNIKVNQTKTIGDEVITKRVSLRCTIMFDRVTLNKYLEQRLGFVVQDPAEDIDLSGGSYSEEEY